MLTEEIKNISSTQKDLKKFGITVGLALLVVTLILFYYAKLSYIYFGTIGILLIVFAYLFPKALKPFQKIWMTLAIILGWFSTRIILSILFYLILTPIGLILRIAGKDFLDEKFSGKKTSYWNYKNREPYNKTDSEKQF